MASSAHPRRYRTRTWHGSARRMDGGSCMRSGGLGFAEVFMLRACWARVYAIGLGWAMIVGLDGLGTVFG
ncbi:hypothetical protein ES332_D02G046300v1 [Gossypium tomentosum]|uniref:Uncharacterized protein n=1 Tax=Gossypium tomentosum TaxID=34277 RepID=A0A5D2LT70_GOSTO|nr:hypothetical protein ES332_D02G046300v1 [Gossypium tomentosum]